MVFCGQLVKEQAREFICGRLGHTPRIALPLQKNDKKKEVLCCLTCEDEFWIAIDSNKWEALLLAIEKEKQN